MTTIESAATTIRAPGAEYEVEEAHLAAVSFLARYNGRTLEAYCHDLRGFFQWATDHDVAVMEASRAHIELFRTWMEDRGLAASTIDRRLSTVCGFYRFAHIDGRIRANPAQYVRRPQVHAPDARGLDRSELGCHGGHGFATDFSRLGGRYPRPPADGCRLAGLPITRRTSHDHHRVGSDNDPGTRGRVRGR
jgi:hypothetical protein